MFTIAYNQIVLELNNNKKRIKLEIMFCVANFLVTAVTRLNLRVASNYACVKASITNRAGFTVLMLSL